MGTKLLLMLHAMVAIGLVGAATHSGLLGVASLRGRAPRPRLERTYAGVVPWLYLASFLLGLCLYPTFRVDVRAAYLDHAFPLGTHLFELKEHLVALGGVGALTQWSLGRRENRSPAEGLLFDLARIAVMAAVQYAGLVGLFVVSVRSV